MLFVSLKATVGFLGPNSEHVYCLTHQESLHVWKVSEVSAEYMSILVVVCVDLTYVKYFSCVSFMVG